MSAPPATSPPPDDRVPPWWIRIPEGFWDQLARPVIRGFETFGQMLQLFAESLLWLFRRPFRIRQFLYAMDFFGVGSLPIIMLVGFFTGAAFSLQVVAIFRSFGTESYIGPVVTISLAVELSPVLTAVMVTARAGSAVATELGSMRITEQIDAMRTMAVNPVQYLVTPRVVAATLVTPMLTMVFTLAGVLGAYAVAVLLMEVDHGFFVSETEWMTDAWDITQGLIKAAIFGLCLAVISCERGYHAQGGARGVGLATTQAVVYSCVTILMLDYFVSDILFILVP
jgi:phospholipid/cholesterol/gamma-HCH transport system permease protein